MIFPRPLILEHCTGTRLFTLYAPFVYKDIEVPQGFTTDGASIPRIFYTLIGGPFMEYIEAAVVHDWMCENTQTYTRKEADDTFLEIMVGLGVKEWRRDLMWRAVSLLQKGSWKDVKPVDTINDRNDYSDTAD